MCVIANHYNTLCTICELKCTVVHIEYVHEYESFGFAASIYDLTSVGFCMCGVVLCWLLIIEAFREGKVLGCVSFADFLVVIS